MTVQDGTKIIFNRQVFVLKTQSNLDDLQNKAYKFQTVLSQTNQIFYLDGRKNAVRISIDKNGTINVEGYN